MIRVLLNMGGEERDIRHFNYYYFKPYRINKTFYRKFLHKNFPFEREDKDNLSPYYDHEIPTVSRPRSILDQELVSRARMYYGNEKENYYKELTRLRYQHKLDFGIIDSEPADLDMMPRYSDIKHHRMGGTESVGGLFSFSFESTHDDDPFYEWFFRGECLKGEFRFFGKMEEIPDFTIEFEEAYAVDLEESYSSWGSDPMMLRMRITPAIVRNRGIVYEKNWKTKKIPFNPWLLLPKEEEKEEPICITDAYWIDDEGNQQHACVTNIPVTLYIETDPPVFDREIKLEFEDTENAEWEKDSFLAVANKDGLLVIENFQLYPKGQKTVNQLWQESKSTLLTSKRKLPLMSDVTKEVTGQTKMTTKLQKVCSAKPYISILKL